MPSWLNKIWPRRAPEPEPPPPEPPPPEPNPFAPEPEPEPEFPVSPDSEGSGMLAPKYAPIDGPTPEYAREQGRLHYNVGDPVEFDGGTGRLVSAVHVAGPPAAVPRGTADPIAYQRDMRKVQPYYPFRALRPGQVTVPSGMTGTVAAIGGQSVVVAVAPSAVTVAGDALLAREQRVLDRLQKSGGHWRFGFARSNVIPLLLEDERTWADVGRVRAAALADGPAPPASEAPALDQGRLRADALVRDARVWHGSPSLFSTPDVTRSQLGFHVGTFAQAVERLNVLKSGDGWLYEFDIDPAKLLRMPDLNNWRGPDILSIVWDALPDYPPGSEEARIVYDSIFAWERYRESYGMGVAPDDKELYRLVREVLQDLGYDGVVYDNGYEGDGDSYILFDPVQPIRVVQVDGNRNPFDIIPRGNEPTRHRPQIEAPLPKEPKAPPAPLEDDPVWDEYEKYPKVGERFVLFAAREQVADWAARGLAPGPVYAVSLTRGRLSPLRQAAAAEGDDVVGLAFTARQPLTAFSSARAAWRDSVRLEDPEVLSRAEAEMRLGAIRERRQAAYPELDALVDELYPDDPVARDRELAVGAQTYEEYGAEEAERALRRRYVETRHRVQNPDRKPTAPGLPEPAVEKSESFEVVAPTTHAEALICGTNNWCVVREERWFNHFTQDEDGESDGSVLVVKDMTTGLAAYAGQVILDEGVASVTVFDERNRPVTVIPDEVKGLLTAAVTRLAPGHAVTYPMADAAYKVLYEGDVFADIAGIPAWEQLLDSDQASDYAPYVVQHFVDDISLLSAVSPESEEGAHLIWTVLLSSSEEAVGDFVYAVATDGDSDPTLRALIEAIEDDPKRVAEQALLNRHDAASLIIPILAPEEVVSHLLNNTYVERDWKGRVRVGSHSRTMLTALGRLPEGAETDADREAVIRRYLRSTPNVALALALHYQNMAMGGSPEYNHWWMPTESAFPMWLFTRYFDLIFEGQLRVEESSDGQLDVWTGLVRQSVARDTPIGKILVSRYLRPKRQAAYPELDALVDGRTAGDDPAVRQLTWQGLPISIEVEGGSTRHPGGRYPVDIPDGWVGYGYFDGVPAVDGDSLDVIVGPSKTDKVYLARQLDADTGEFAQYKVMLQFGSEEAARAGFLAMWPSQMFGGVEETDFDALQETVFAPTKIRAGDLVNRQKLRDLKRRASGSSNSAYVYVPIPLEWPEVEGNGPPHFTLAYLPGPHTAVDLAAIEEAVEAVAWEQPPFRVELAPGVRWLTTGRGKEVAYKAPDRESGRVMREMHGRLAKRLADAGVAVSTYDRFVPHGTIGYADEREYDGLVPDGRFVAGRVCLYAGGSLRTFDLGGELATRLEAAVSGGRRRLATIIDLNPPGTFSGGGAESRDEFAGETYFTRGDDARCTVVYAQSDAVPKDPKEDPPGVREVRLEPDARVLREGSKEWLNLFSEGLPGLVDVIRRATEGGYDAVRIGEALAILSGVAIAQVDGELQRKNRQKRQRERGGWLTP